MKFPWTALSERLTEQKYVIERLRERCSELETEARMRSAEVERTFNELREACIEPRRYFVDSMSVRSGYVAGCDAKPYTAMDAVNLLLKHNGLEITAEPAKDAKHKLVPIKTAKKK
jgi:hypothetical protein